MKSWWTKKDEAEFKKRADVMVTQFNNFEPLPGTHINGKNTLGENIADLGGILSHWTLSSKRINTKKMKRSPALLHAALFFGLCIGMDELSNQPISKKSINDRRTRARKIQGKWAICKCARFLHGIWHPACK